jgi:type II secretory pathway component PulK
MGIDRRGAIIVFALMAMLATTLMIAQLLKTASISHRQLKLDEYRIQASLLADAGWARAALRLKNQADYTGEVWTVPSEQLGPGKTAEVRLNVTANPTKPDERILVVVAEYPVGRVDLVRVSRKFVVP